MIDTAALVEQAAADPVVLRLKGQIRKHSIRALKASNAEHFTSLRNTGRDINVWTVNDEAALKNLIAMGATGLFTDFPLGLKPVLDSL